MTKLDKIVAIQSEITELWNDDYIINIGKDVVLLNTDYFLDTFTNFEVDNKAYESFIHLETKYKNVRMVALIKQEQWEEYKNVSHQDKKVHQK